MNRDERIKDGIRVLMTKGFFDMQSGQVVIDIHNGLIHGLTFITKPYKRKKDLTRKQNKL